MPPCRTTPEMREDSMPDSRATIASASSDASRCWMSKSAGTYSASITGVIGSTLSSRTAPFQVCDRVAAVAIAGFARSVSARSIGTRMDLNILRPLYPCQTYHRSSGWRRGLSLLQKLWADKQHESSAAECHVVPVVDGEVEHHKPRCRQIVAEPLAGGGVAAAGERQRQFVHPGIVADQHQPLRIGDRSQADRPQQLRRFRAIKVRNQLDMRLRRPTLHRLPGDVPSLMRPDCRRNQHGIRKRRIVADPAADFRGILVAALVEPAVLITTGRSVGLGLGMTQQHQTAHNAVSIRFGPN